MFARSSLCELDARRDLHGRFALGERSAQNVTDEILEWSFLGDRKNGLGARHGKNELAFLHGLPLGYSEFQWLLVQFCKSALVDHCDHFELVDRCALAEHL